MLKGSFSNDMDIKNFGIFLEYNRDLAARSRLLTGLRYDKIDTDYHNARFRNPMGMLTRDLVPGSTSDRAVSGFVRWERTAKKQPLTFYVGVGHAERPADYWEAYHTWLAYSNRRLGMHADPAAHRPRREKNTQLDLGWVYKGKKTSANLSLYYAHIHDYILRLPQIGMGMNARTPYAQTLAALDAWRLARLHARRGPHKQCASPADRTARGKPHGEIQPQKSRGKRRLAPRQPSKPLS